MRSTWASTSSFICARPVFSWSWLALRIATSASSSSRAERMRVRSWSFCCSWSSSSRVTTCASASSLVFHSVRSPRSFSASSRSCLLTPSRWLMRLIRSSFCNLNCLKTSVRAYSSSVTASFLILKVEFSSVSVLFSDRAASSCCFCLATTAMASWYCSLIASLSPLAGLDRFPFSSLDVPWAVAPASACCSNFMT